MEEEKLSGAVLGARLVELYGNERAVESFKKKLTFGDFASKDESRLFMTGVFYEEGFAVATDGRILLKQKADYPKEWEGKIVSLSDGKEIKDCEFPKYKIILEREGRYVSRQNLLEKENKFLESSVALVGAKLAEASMIPVSFGDGEAAAPAYLAKALGWAQSRGYGKCEQLVYQRPLRDNDYQTVLDEKGKPVMEDVYSQLRFSAADGSELVLMPLASESVKGRVVMSAGAALECLSDKNSYGASIAEIQVACLGKGEGLYRGIAEEWLSKQGVSLKDAEKSFSEKLSKAKERGKSSGFPVKREDCLAVAAAWTVAEGLGEKIGERGFEFAPGESQISLENFMADMYLDKIRRIAKHPERLFDKGYNIEELDRPLLNEAKSGGLLKEATPAEDRPLPGFQETEEPAVQAEATVKAPEEGKVSLNGILNAMQLMCSATADGKYKLYDWKNDKPVVGKDGSEEFVGAADLLAAAGKYVDEFYGVKLRHSLKAAGVGLSGRESLSELCSLYQEAAKDAESGLNADSFAFKNALAAAYPALCEMPKYEATVRIGGEVWKVRDVEEGIKGDVERLFREWGSGEAEENLVLNGVRLYGDLGKNLEKDGDVKVLVEFDSKNPENRWREDAVFNALADEGLEIGGVKIDFNPITPEKSGTISEYLARLEKLDSKTEAQAIKKLDGMIREKEAGKAAVQAPVAAATSGKKEKRTSCKGLRFFDRNYSEADEFLQYFNSMRKPGSQEMSQEDAEAILRALDHFNVGCLRGRNERLALNESDELVFVTREKDGFFVEKTSPQGVISRAVEKAEKELSEVKKMVGDNAVADVAVKFARTFLKSYEEQARALSEISGRLVGAAEGMDFKAGQSLAGRTVRDAFQIGSGVWQVDFGSQERKDARLVLSRFAFESVPENLRGCFSQSEDGDFVMENKFADPYVYKALVEAGRVMPRDENYMEMLSAHVKKYPAKYISLYPVTKESFGDCMRKLSKIDGTTDPLELSNKLLKLVQPSKVTELYKWIGKMSEVSPGVRSEPRLRAFLKEMLDGAERKREKARAGGYPPRGE